MKRIGAVLILLALLLTGCAETSGRETETASEAEQGSLFTFTFLTIGKGDAFLLTAPDGSHYLVDTGKEEDYPQIARALDARGVKRLEGIFLSHGHKDHIGGLKDLLRHYPVDAVYISAEDNVTYQMKKLKKMTENTELRFLSSGDVLDLGGVRADIWLPAEQHRKNENNNSMVMLLSWGEVRFLLMGDAERKEEEELLSSGFPVSARVLKLGHHGEEDATGEDFLRAVGPEIGIVTGNAEENPESVNEVISSRLSRNGVKVFYSESDGLGIDFITDGTDLWTETLYAEELPE